MTNINVLHKLLQMKEEEKDRAQKEKIDAMDHFEQIAKKLYVELKAKEQAEEQLYNHLGNCQSISTIKAQSIYIESIHHKIILLQQQVERARNVMEKKDELFMEAHIEVKKMEKMIEKRIEEAKELEKRNEMRTMDDVSIRQFTMRVQNR